MRWLVREASLITGLAALILVLQPDWLPLIVRAWLVLVASLGSGGILMEVVGRIPTERWRNNIPRNDRRGEISHMGEIEQANEFLIAVDLQLVGALDSTVRTIAADRLLAHHNVVLERDLESARSILGEDAWQILRPPAARNTKAPWVTLNLAQLRAVVDALEKV